MTMHPYTEDQLIEQPGIALFGTPGRQHAVRPGLNLGARPLVSCRVLLQGIGYGLNLFEWKPADAAKCLSRKQVSFEWKPA